MAEYEEIVFMLLYIILVIGHRSQLSENTSLLGPFRLGI